MTSAESYRERVSKNRWKPRNCVWEITRACNLRCAHCGSSAGRCRDDELSTGECLDVVDQLARAGCELITLSGGEPTLRKDWDRIAAAVAARGILVNMVSNGLCADRAAAREIGRRARDAGMCNVGISIDGPPEQHEALRGAGTFARTLQTVETLAADGLSVGVMTTVNRHNLPHLRQVHRLAIEAGASMWRLQLAKPMGEMAALRDWTLRPTDLLELVPLLAALKGQRGINLQVGDSIGYYGAPDRRLRGRGWRGRREVWQGCQAGMQAIGIEADGGVKGCLSLQARWGTADPFVAGNLRRERLDAIWHRPGVFGFNRDFDRRQLTGFCVSCRYARLCRGGARCVSAAFIGSLAEDPFCYHRVITLQQRSQRRARVQSAASAAAALLLTLGPLAGGCGGRAVTGDATAGSDAQTTVDRGVPGSDASVAADAGSGDLAATADQGPDAAIDCNTVCCMCDYGIIPDEVWDTCCAPCYEEPCPDCDYGVPPPWCK